MKRRLTLKREVLQELAAAELSGIAGAAPPDTTQVAETAYSCLAYISCAVPFCLIARDTLVRCIVVTD